MKRQTKLGKPIKVLSFSFLDPVEKRRVVQSLRRSFFERLEKALPLRNDYRETKIRKKSGGYRTIFIPSLALKKVQREILGYLRGRWISYHGVYGLSPGTTSYVDHAKFHKGSRWFFKFDIKDAFPSTPIATLREILSQAIFESPPFWDEKEIERAKRVARARASLIIKLTTFQGKLPQGTPTSPFLFYMFLTSSLFIEKHGTIKHLGGLFPKLWYACPRDWKISCYVDGFVVSGQKPLPPDIQERMFRIVKEEGLEVNHKKTQLLDRRHGVPLVTGLRIKHRSVSLPKKTIRKWRGFIYRTAYKIENSSELNNDLKKELQRISGFLVSLKPIYKEWPGQLKKPCHRLSQALIKFQEIPIQ